jgi:ABC-type spermidine/putrescine transport system permease subunit II
MRSPWCLWMGYLILELSHAVVVATEADVRLTGLLDHAAYDLGSSPGLEAQNLGLPL